MSIRAVKGGSAVIKDGIYDAVAARPEERRDDGKHFYIFNFRVPCGRREAQVSGLVSPLLADGTDLDRWLVAILGREIEFGEELDLEAEVPGNRCRVRVETVTRSGRRYSNVVDVLPAGD